MITDPEYIVLSVKFRDPYYICMTHKAMYNVGFPMPQHIVPFPLFYFDLFVSYGIVHISAVHRLCFCCISD